MIRFHDIKAWWRKHARGEVAMPPLQGDELLQLTDDERWKKESFPRSLGYYIDVYREASRLEAEWRKKASRNRNDFESNLDNFRAAHYSSIRNVSVDAICSKEFETTASLQFVYELLKSKDPDDRENGAAIASTIRKQQLVDKEAMIDAFRQEADKVVMTAMLEAISKLFPSEPEVTNALIESIEDESFREEMAEAFGR